LRKIIAVVEQAARLESTVAVETEARRLLRAHPRCPMSLDELRNEVLRVAAARGCSIELGEEV
jgi:hypothetical protein